jgi:hypothetical protein
VFGATAALFLGLVVGYRTSPMGNLGLFVLVALVAALAPRARRYRDRHTRMLKGAVAERNVGVTLNELRREPGWVVMRDVKQEHEGNIDHLVWSPNGVYLVETKLGRYEDSQLVNVKRHAARVHDELGCWVSPVICLHTRAGRAFQAKSVWIVPHRELLDWLRAQRNRTVPFERLARYADSV